MSAVRMAVSTGPGPRGLGGMKKVRIGALLGAGLVLIVIYSLFPSTERSLIGARPWGWGCCENWLIPAHSSPLHSRKLQLWL